MKFAATIALVLCLAVFVPAQNHEMASAPGMVQVAESAH
jgi:hypothetical protein